MSNGNSVINLGDLSKPATVLIEKIADAVGAIFAPSQIKRIAKAEADAQKIKTLANIELTAIEQRALIRLQHEEAIRQANIESITRKALPLLSKGARPEAIEADWMVNFFDKCRLVSDREMQEIWSRILAGEANAPGKFSKRTVALMASLDKSDAVLFTKLCGFNWRIGDQTPLIFNTDDEIYTKEGITFATVNHLATIGLITFESLTGYVRAQLGKKVSVRYGDVQLGIEFPKDKDNELQLGHVLLTDVGRALAKITGPVRVAGLIEYVEDRWRRNGLTIQKSSLPATR